MNFGKVIITLLISLYLVACNLTFFNNASNTKINSTDKIFTPPNIIFIMSDDHSERAISAYGSKLIQTPNIDRIANE